MRECKARPQRQARSGVTYKESDDDDNDFVPSSTTTRLQQPGSVAKGKRTLTLKRARTTLEPPVSLAKEEYEEDVDVYALPAVEEKSASARVVQFREVSAERVWQSSAFECLLEAVSDASGDGEEAEAEAEEGGNPSAQPVNSGSKPEVKKEEKTTSAAAYGPELLAAYSAFERKLQAVKGVVKEEADAPVKNEEETRVIQGTKEMNEKSSGDEKKYVRRAERANMPPSKTEIKKLSEQDMSSADDDDDDDEENVPWNESSDTEKKTKMKEKQAASVTTVVKNLRVASSNVVVAKSTSEAHFTSAAEQRVVMPAKPTSVTPPASLPKKRPALWGGMAKPFVPPGPKTPQTPTSHRRVVGLSRRHRPPPLHPYLLES